MKKSITLITILLLLAVSFVSCGSKDEPEVIVPFSLISTTPPDGATSVPLNTVIKFVFSEKIAFDAKCFTYEGLNGIDGLLWSVDYDNDKTVTITFGGRGLLKNDDIWIGVWGLKSAKGVLLPKTWKGEAAAQVYLNFKTVI